MGGAWGVEMGGAGGMHIGMGMATRLVGMARRLQLKVGVVRRL